MRSALLRMLFALGLLFGGLLIRPLESLPQRPFTWHNYAPVHVPPPAIDVGITSLPQNDLLEVKGSGFAPDRPVALALNRQRLTQVYADAEGEFAVIFARDLADATINEVTALSLDTAQLRPTSLQIAQIQWMDQGQELSAKAAGLVPQPAGWTP